MNYFKKCKKMNKHIKNKSERKYKKKIKVRNYGLKKILCSSVLKISYGI